MDLPDESQWDETTCDLAVCQHPQCWATIRRIERGHPRILGTPCKTPLDAEVKLPVLTIVNISNSCFRAKRPAHHHLSGFSFTKSRSLLSRGSKFDSKFQGRPQKNLPEKNIINCTNRSPKLSVLNLNETQLPCPQDVRNTVVIWIPEEPEKHVSPGEKKHIVPCQDGKKKRMEFIVKGKSSLVLPRKQNTETPRRLSWMPVPPPSPVHVSEQLHPESISSWNHFDVLPQVLLKDLLPGEGKTMPCLKMKTQLAMMKKKLPLGRSRPDSAISAKMFLSVHRLTLQRPALRYPEHVRKLHYNLNTEGRRKPQQCQLQQQRKVKTPAKKQETKKKSKSDPGSQNTLHKRSSTLVYDPCHGRTALPVREGDRQQRRSTGGLTLKQDSNERPHRDDSEDHLDSCPTEENPELSMTEPTNEGDISAQMDVVLEAQKETPKDHSAIISRATWNPELKLLRILQATHDEDEGNQTSGSQTEESMEA
nr:uncharacterized protein C9orf43 homolog isoform X1 [Manis javanica]XP_017504262.2 uncharacterized protein C9orf43 homolog isoform X1 [Manis javanica]XP_017504263.2 uncharacterized protein C9orf43 homolog isoform X1 [Manis javanica]